MAPAASPSQPLTIREYQPAAITVTGAVGIDGLLIDGRSRPRITPAVTRPVPLPNDASILPSLEVSIRHDGGDAETGFGLELGTSIVWHDPERGISAELRGRSLPIQLGTTIPLPSQAVGITSSGDMDALLQPTVMEGVDGPASQ